MRIISIIAGLICMFVGITGLFVNEWGESIQFFFLSFLLIRESSR